MDEFGEIDVVDDTQGVTRLRDLIRRQRRDSDTFADLPELDYDYEDRDHYRAEIAELFSYSEEHEMLWNRTAFEQALRQLRGTASWRDLILAEKKAIVSFLLNECEISDRPRRSERMRAILYVAMGVFGEHSSVESWESQLPDNVFLLLECGVFTAFLELLNLEVAWATDMAASQEECRRTLCMTDNAELRLILNVLNLITEVCTCDLLSHTEHQRELKNQFTRDLGKPLLNDELLTISLFRLVVDFCNGKASFLPIKKLLLLLWKVMVVSLGGLTTTLYTKKNVLRHELGLPDLPEDPVEVIRGMRSPSGGSVEIDAAAEQRETRAKRAFRRIFGVDGTTEIEPRDDTSPTISRSESPVQPASNRGQKKLPWKTKVRQEDLERFVNQSRRKFIGYGMERDVTSLFGLPKAIHLSVDALKQNLYISLAEKQMEREELIRKFPLTQGETELPDTPQERLYQAMLPIMPQCSISLLKILLAATPTAKSKNDAINLLIDVMPDEMPITVVHSMKLGVDANRHKEVIVKTVSAILLLLLKHFKLNHIYQFEYLSQHLVFANCIPLVLKFFNQNVLAYVQAKNTVSMLEFPNCVIGMQDELTEQTLESGDNMSFCWRNLSAIVNLLRILNKLVKWKRTRTMMLVLFKSAPILKKILKVRAPMVELYTLKLIKLQAKYLGRNWRKNHMRIVSAIYCKVRHRLHDDWAFANETEPAGCDFQQEEESLRARVEHFNNRRYLCKLKPRATYGVVEPDLVPSDHSLLTALSAPVELPHQWDCEKWVDREVLAFPIDWDRLIQKKWLV